MSIFEGLMLLFQERFMTECTPQLTMRHMITIVCNLGVQALVFLVVSVCCDTAQALVFLLMSVCCDTAQALVFLNVSVCCHTAQAGVCPR